VYASSVDVRALINVLYNYYSSQSLYALRVLRHYGLTDVCLHTVFRSVVVAKLLYACTARSGFITASDRHRVDAFLRRSKRCGYCYPDLQTFNELLVESDCDDESRFVDGHASPCHGLLRRVRNIDANVSS